LTIEAKFSFASAINLSGFLSLSGTLKESDLSAEISLSSL
jgi:hypothetical protein